MLAESSKPKKDKLQKKEIKEANIAKRSNKWYKKEFQCKEFPFNLDNKEGSLIISKEEERLLKQFKQIKI